MPVLIDLGGGIIVDRDKQLLALDRLDCEESLADFVRHMWHVVEPVTPLKWGWSMDAICEHLEAVTYGDITRLLMNVPPGSSKSLLCNVFWPAWEWARFPHLRFLSFSYAAHLTERDNRRFRDVILSPRYQAMFKDRFKLSKKGEENVSNDKTGFKIATSVGGVGTGERGDRVVLDDPHNVKDNESDVIRKGTVDFFATAMSNRLNDMEKSAIVVIMQRVHEADVSGYILEKDLGYDHLCIPAEYEKDRHCSTVIGWEDPRQEEGETFWQERFPPRVLNDQRKLMGPFGYCNPAEAPVLMSDLSLKPIGDVRVGDEVVGFELDTTPLMEDGGYSRRQLKFAKIVDIHRSVRPVVKMTMDSGEVIRCTPDHRWYRGRAGVSRSAYGEAVVGTKLMRVCPPRLPELTVEEERLAGWLGGFFDGEGSVSLMKREQGTDNPLITFSQGNGTNAPLCKKLEETLEHFGFDYEFIEKERTDRKSGTSNHQMHWYYLRGRRLPLAQRFLHIAKPTKWRERLIKSALGARFITDRERVVSIEPDGEEEVFSLTTTTGNYVVWGFASSNSGQYQQRPDPAGGGIIMRDWWQLWEDKQFPPMDFIMASLDTAYTEKEENDECAMTIWGIFSMDPTAQAARVLSAAGVPMYINRSFSETAPKVMLMHAWAERFQFHQLVTKVAESCKRYRVDTLLIENKAAGISCAQELRRLHGHEPWSVVLSDPKSQDKTARLYSVQHLFADGTIYAPDRSWSDKVITQCAQFPKGKHDDLVDTVSQALRRLRDMGMLQRSVEVIADQEAAMQHVSRQTGVLYPS